MKRVGKVKFFIVIALLFLFIYTTFFGVNFSNYYGDKETFHFGVRSAADIRWGIDISGGVEAVFSPDKKDLKGKKPTHDQMDSAKKIIETRLVNNNITDYEVFVDYDKGNVVVRFPQKKDKDEQFDPQEVIAELGETASLEFYENNDLETKPILTGKDVKKASSGYDEEQNGYVVYLALTKSGANKFSTATQRLNGNGTIAIYMDAGEEGAEPITNPQVNAHITDGNAIITGDFDNESAKDLADKINAGALPFKLSYAEDKIQIISPSLGSEALTVMVTAGIIAFAAICLIMILKYRLPGFIACIALLGQAAGMIAAVSGYFDSWQSFTLTVPGIAGMILSIGMGVDANVITTERIREELANGKTLDSAIDKGFSNAFSSILDGNVTNVLVAIVLMGAFGTTEGIFYKLFSPILQFFTPSITGAIYSFGYTLLAGVIVNFIMAVFASRLMLKGISKFKVLRNPWLYGGAKNEKA